MAQQPLKISASGTLSKSIDDNQPDFQPDVQLTANTVNMTSGIVEGIGPRYGFAPIPRHSDTEALTGFLTPGLMLAETQLSQPETSASRTKVLGIFPVRFGGAGANINTISTYYLWVLGYTDSNYAGKNLVDVFYGCTQSTSGGTASQAATITDGFFRPVISDTLDSDIGITTQYVSGPNPFNPGTTLGNIANLQNFGAVNYVSAAVASISNPTISNQWYIGLVTNVGGATTAPSSTLFNILTPSTIFAGCPSTFLYGNFNKSPRTILVYALTSTGTLNIEYSVNVATPTTTIFSPNGYVDGSGLATPNINLSGLTATKLTSGTSYASSIYALYNDPYNTCASSFQCVLLASATPMAVIFQDWYRDVFGRLQQYFDMCHANSAPISVTSSRYTENWGVAAQQVASCFNSWPAFVQGTGMVTDATLGTALGAANTGLLRANTIYEFTYSKYNKRLNFESNVGAPVKIQTGATDFVSLIISKPTGGVSPWSEWVTGSGTSVLPSPFGTATNSVGDNPDYLNFMEYRFYYRQYGMEVWLPAATIDAANYWFNPNASPVYACTGAIGGTPGGEAGAFQDYSLLPQDNYTCVVMYKNRAFWLSDKALVFSLGNNIFAYPARNSAACPQGSFKGALVQAYYGQAIQNARLVIFSTAGTYVGTFTGNQQVVSLTLDTASPPTVAQFPLDGSDFVINAWTSVTAFSYRSAVVAEGLLYWWGPEGIFLDDGVNPIQRISVPIEPLIFNLYNPSMTDAICCEYNNTTKEVIWFYTPSQADASYPTHGLVYNKLKNQWLFVKFAGQIDDAQSIHIDQNIPTGGTRMVVFSRANAAATTQRAYFFDQNNLAADIFPGGELLVKSITSPTTTTRHLTLASGHSTGTITAGDLIAVQQCSAYTNGALTSPSDFIAEVTAVGSGTLTIALPAGATLDASATISGDIDFFPIWHAAGANGVITGAGINGFPYELDTKYWVPNGMSYWAMWVFMHLIYKLYDLLPVTIPLTQSFSYSTTAPGSTTQNDVLTLVQNSGQNCQILHPLTVGGMSMEGQGIKLTFSGYQLASSWVLQFLAAYSAYMDGPQLKVFEG